MSLTLATATGLLFLAATSAVAAQEPATAAPVVADQAHSRMVRRFGADHFRVAGTPVASALAPDGTKLAVLSTVFARGKVLLHVLDAETGRTICRGTADFKDGVFSTPRVAFSPDGKHVAAAVNSETCVVWSTATGAQVVSLSRGNHSYALCQFTTDGLLILAGSKQTDLFDIPSGKLVKTWPTGGICRLTPDAKTFLRVDREFTTISLGDPATGEVAAKLDIPTADNGADGGLAFSRDGRKLIAVWRRKQLQLWDVAARKKEAEAPIPSEAIDERDPFYAVTFAPDGNTIALTTKGQIYRWQTRTLEPLRTLRASWATHVRGVQWANDNKTIFAPASTGLVCRWDATSGKPLPGDGYNSRVRFALSPDGTRLIVGDHAGRIDVWDSSPTRATNHAAVHAPHAPRLLRQLSAGRDTGSALLCLAIAPDGKRVAVGDGGGAVRVYRTGGGEDAPLVPENSTRSTPWFDFLRWARDGKSIFMSDHRTVRSLTPDGKLVWRIYHHEGQGYALTPDGRFLVTAKRATVDAATVAFREATTGEVTHTFRVSMPEWRIGDARSIGALAFSPDGARIAVAVDQAIAVLDARGKELLRFDATDPPPPLSFNEMRFGGQPQVRAVESIAFTPDGKWIVSGGQDLAVKVWETVTGKLVMRLGDTASSVEQVAVAPDGRTAYSAGWDGFVDQWDLTPDVPGKAHQAAPTLPELWAAASEHDSVRGVPAAWALVQSEAGRAYLVKNLPPAAPPASAVQIDKWLAALDAPKFTDRDAATAALAACGRTVEPRLRQIVTTAKIEVQRRAQTLLARLEKHTTDEIRAMRIVKACEHSAAPGARDLLKRWAGGASGAMLTEDAKAALSRLTAPH